MNFTPFIQLPILRVCGVDFNPFYLPSVYTAALSMPPSSCVMKLSRSPTVCDTGLSVNSQFSRRDGKGTVNTERPSLTSTRASEISGNMYDRLIHPTQQALFNRIILIKVILKKNTEKWTCLDIVSYICTCFMLQTMPVKNTMRFVSTTSDYE